MTNISGVGPAAPVSRASERQAAGRGGFALPAGRHTALAAGAPDVVEVSLAGLLALQEDEYGEAQDHHARRRGRDILDELAVLQRALLDGEVPAGRLQRLAELVRDMPPATDPRLHQVMEAIAVRAQVELARLGH